MDSYADGLKFEYDVHRDVFTIEGNHFSGQFFRFFGPANEGKLFRLVRVKDGEIRIREISEKHLTRRTRRR